MNVYLEKRESPYIPIGDLNFGDGFRYYEFIDNYVGIVLEKNNEFAKVLVFVPFSDTKEIQSIPLDSKVQRSDYNITFFED